MTLDKTTLDDWEEIASEIKRAEQQYRDAFQELAGTVPKTVWRNHTEKIEDGFKGLRSDLEERMFDEHGDEADIQTFYGDLDSDATFYPLTITKSGYFGITAEDSRVKCLECRALADTNVDAPPVRFTCPSCGREDEAEDWL